MSLFPAIVPQGTMLHHGTSMPEAVTGMEGVAFERDHALQFAHYVSDSSSIAAASRWRQSRASLPGQEQPDFPQEQVAHS